MAPKGIIILSTEQLRKLAKVMYHRGVQAIHYIKFKSEFERVKYLTSCRGAFVDTYSLISTTESTIDEFKDDPRVVPIVYAYAAYINGSLSFAHQSIKMYGQRAVFINQFKKHSSNILKVLREHKINPLSQAKIAPMTEDITLLSKTVLNYAAEVASPVARKFSRIVRTRGFTLAKWVRRYQAQLGFKGRFERLGLERQTQVLNKVMESTGAKVIKYGKETMEVVGKYGGRAVYALTVVAAVVDMFSAEPDKALESVVKNAVTIGAAILVGEVEVIILEAAFSLVCTGNPILIAAGVALAVADYFIASLVLDFIKDKVVPVVASVFDWIGQLFSTLFSWLDHHDSHPKRHGPYPLSTAGFIVRGPGLPDGKILAQQIAYKA